MRYASIDIGTNTILMLIGEIEDNLTVTRIEDFYEVPRVGRDVSSTKNLDSESISRGLEVLSRYCTIARDYRVDRTVASATSAVRDAENRDEFIRLVKESCKVDVEVIDGVTEARLGFLGALSATDGRSGPTLVVDIGGGSTELSYGDGRDPVITVSLDIGAVRVKESFFGRVPPDSEELRRASDFIEGALMNFPFSEVKPRSVFAVAGTATTLALIAQRKYDFEVSAVTNYEMSLHTLKEVFQDLRNRSPEEIRVLTKAAEGREDVLLAGSLILLKVLEKTGVNSFFATDRGLRYGYLIHKHTQFMRQ